MGIVNLFSKRQKVLRKEVPDVYEYAQIPDPLRVQIAHILRDLYTIDDVVDQIVSGMSCDSVVLEDASMTAMENPNARRDRYGNDVRDRVVFECMARHPRPELFGVMPKGDLVKPQK